MIGRQGIHMTPRIVKAVLRRHGVTVSDQVLDEIYSDGYAEQLFTRVLGASIADSIDASAYEGASLIADLNVPFDTSAEYSAVVDCGTLEHCFNAPQAFTNVINICATGGHIIHVLPTNNYCGHGFYQFSPEFFFSLYDQKRGFKLMGIYLAEEGVSTRWWGVQSPIERRSRVTLCNFVETHVLVVARKCEGAKTPLEEPPYQSDYEQTHWRGSSPGHFKTDQVLGNHWLKDQLFSLGLFGPARLAKRAFRWMARSGQPTQNGFRKTQPGETQNIESPNNSTGDRYLTDLSR
jgi:hypothetical protein